MFNAGHNAALMTGLERAYELRIAELERRLAEMEAMYDKVAADRGRVALRYGPLVYCIESPDQDVDGVLPPDAPLTTAWEQDLLGGVVVLRSKFADGKPLVAVPYYARANRGGRSYRVLLQPLPS